MPDKISTSRLYTLLLEFSGTTSVSQVQAQSPEEAVRQWIAKLLEPKAYGLSKGPARSLKSALDRQDGDSLAALNGLTRVWCATALVKKELALLHIVETKA